MRNFEGLEYPLTNSGSIDTMGNIDTAIHKIDKEGNLTKVEKIEDIKKQRKTRKNSLIGDLNYLSVGYFISTPIIVGVVAGILIDKAFKMANNPSTFILIVIGALGSIYNIFSLTKQEKNKDAAY